MLKLNPFLPMYLKENAQVENHSLLKYTLKYRMTSFGMNVKLTLHFETPEQKIKKVSYQHGYGDYEFNVTGDDYLYLELNKNNLQYDNTLKQILKDSAYIYANETGKKEASYSQKF